MPRILQLLIFALSLFLTSNQTQLRAQTLKTVTLPAPDASSLGKYGETPVGYYTGIPQISIPIYTIKTKDLELPISLSYHAGGVKLEEVPSGVGSGWSFNAGGVITRSIRGLADLYSNMNIFSQVASVGQSYGFQMVNRGQWDAGNALTDFETVKDVGDGFTDGEPDVYYFNFGSYSGSFFLANGQFIVSPKQGIKVEQFPIHTVTTPDVAQWKLTTPDGVQYYFGVSQDSARTGIEKNNTGDSRNPVTSWYLMDIISPNNDQINFTYTVQTYSYKTRAGQTLNLLLGQPSPGEFNSLNAQESKILTNTVNEPRLSAITYSMGKVVVNSNTVRNDLQYCKRIDGIDIFNYTNPEIPLTKFQFEYDYSIGNRLTLIAIEEKTGFTNGPVGKRHTFTYHSTIPGIPQRDVEVNNINAQDLWGYFNGMTSNSTTVPSYVLSYNGASYQFYGGDRHADAALMKSGVLSSITYPTGGKTEFEYEAHTVYSNNSFDGIPPVPEIRRVSMSYSSGQSDTSSFTIADAENGKAKVSISSHSQLDGCTIDPQSGVSFCNTVTVQGINGTNYPARQIPEGNSYLELPDGNYQVVGQGLTVNGNSSMFYVSIDWNEYPSSPKTSPLNKTVGGVRILRIKNTDGIGNTVSLKKYTYGKLDEPTQSSGVLVNFPSPHLRYYTTLGHIDNQDPIEDAYVFNLYAQVRSTPNVPLTATGGGVIGYENVTEWEGENGENGKTEYTFTTAKDSRDFFYYYKPYPSPISYDFRRGKLKLKTVYRNNAGSFVPVTSVRNHYATGLKSETAYGLAVENQNATINESPERPWLPLYQHYYVSGTELISELLYLNQTITRSYDNADPARFVETTEDFQYDKNMGHYQLVKTTTKNSKGQTIETTQKYPQDVSLPAGPAETARQSLVSKHIWTPILQQTTYLDGVQLQQTTNNYKLYGSLVLPESVETKRGTLQSDKRVEFLKYDAYGNILQQRKFKDAIQFVIWDYKNALPIATIMNPSESRIDTMAYTSFEADGKGNWSYSGLVIGDATSPTGNKCYFLGSPITKSNLSTTTTYIVSYWKKTGTVAVNGTPAEIGRSVRGWTYYEHKVSNPAGGSITVSGTSALIDELRLYPLNAQMTTYTYQAGLGITSQCDPNNRITYYEYDNFSRLLLIRDQDFNIQKRFGYTYTNQTENNSLVYNTELRKPFVSECSGCMISWAVDYIVPAGTFLAPTSTEATQLAMAFADEHGPAYANAFSSCSTPVNTAIKGSNGLTIPFTVQFQNTNANCSPNTYTFTINAGASMVTLGSVLEGKYNITFSAGTDPNGYRYRVNGITLDGVGGTITADIKSSASNQVSIAPRTP